MRDLGLEKWVVQIDTVAEGGLPHLFDELILGKEKYIDNLKQLLPVYIEKSQKSIFFVKDIYKKKLYENQ
jgi:hypothetical protein